MPVEQDAYDAVPYPGYAYPDTHPDRIAVMARLHGLDPAPVEQCRVLEIGCGEGANLIPMAYAIPRSEFVGFDLAGLPVARGQRRIAELGLTNIRLLQANLMDGGWMESKALGRFDYIVAHGLYAWVPEPVRDRLLALCRERLSPHGIAFISYNALPGGHLRNMVREMMLHRVAAIDDPAQRVSEALDFLKFFAECRPEGEVFRQMLEKEIKQLQSKPAEVVYHDELSSEYHPVLFSGFMEHAARHGLQYVSEAVLPPPNDPCFQPQVVARAKVLAKGDLIAEEQMLDFARMRVYRETLLCHAEQAVDPDLCAEAFGQLRLASRAESSPGEGNALRAFMLPGGVRIESRDAASVALMEHLIEAWPRSVPFADLERFLETKGLMLDAELFRLLLRLVVARMIELHAWAAPVSGGIAERPRASAVSRQEATGNVRVTTLLHTSLGLDDPMVRRFLLLLDGTRDREELLEALRVECPEMPEATLAEGIAPALHLLHRAGVLLEEGFG